MPATSPRCTNCKVEYDIGRDFTSQFNTVFSPVYHLLRSHEPPNPAETLAITNMLSEARDILAAVDAMADHLCEVMKLLTDEKRHHQALILEHTNLLGPIRNIPQDVLGYIFLLCLPSSEEASFDFKNAPLVLTQVCKEWQQCAYIY
ncbi:hypothetical protein FIBSPDRAFT_755175 [Athelia psychrophila]|uniref:F-box domain-containing protein n=1 Tax=Athelia psychrophila TaxID=1759441 RepID=A0A166B302_9AGAM|nr:hypothetical protein FIBSPDRAFT_755175 [Fibularhizoctonia sp. CBS 109695]